MPPYDGYVPKYRLQKTSGQAVVTLCGKTYYLGPHGTKTSKAEYDRLVMEWLAAGRRLPDRDPEAGFTIDELILAFWEHAERHYRKNGEPTSELSCFKSAVGPVRKLYGHTQAANFGPLCLKACRQMMIESGWERESINKHVGRIKRMFRWAAENELIDASICQALDTVAGLQKGRSKAVETEDVKPVAAAVVDAVRPFVSRQVWAMIELQRLTAMRSGEAVIMRGADITMTGNVWIYVPESHKTEHHGRGREIYLGPKAQAVIKPFLATDLSKYLFSPADAELERLGESRKRSGGRQPGKRYTVDSYRKAIVRACEKAFDMPADLRKIPSTLPEEEIERRRQLASEWREVNCWFPHQLRHSAATYARKHADLDAARIICGHAKENVTEIYAAIDRRKAMEFMEQHG